MRSYFILAIITVLLSMFAACKKDQIVNSNISSQEILPLATGNSWNYYGTWVDSKGTIINTLSINMTTFGPDTVGSFVGYGIRDFFWPFVASILTNRSDGVYAVDNPSYLPIPHPPPNVVRVLPFPTSPGDTVTCVGLSQGIMIRTKALSQTISVPSGTFSNCVVYDFFENDSLMAEAYLSPGVGVTRMWLNSGSIKQIYVLTGYVLH